MKRFALLCAFIFLAICLNAQEYIKSNRVDNGTHIIEAYPSMFEYQTEQYLLCWNYISNNRHEMYYLSILCNDQVAPWYVQPGDKAYLRFLNETSYHEITALLDAEPEEYISNNGKKKYRTLASYMIPSSMFDSLYKGFDRFLLKVKLQSNDADVSIAVEMPFSAIEHMLMSYLNIMVASGK